MPHSKCREMQEPYRGENCESRARTGEQTLLVSQNQERLWPISQHMASKEIMDILLNLSFGMSL